MLKLGTDSGRTIRIRSRLSIPRTEIRQSNPIPGKLIVSPEAPIVICCAITDLSSSGAELELDQEQHLPEMMLLFETFRQNIYECRLYWQEKQLAGLSLLDLCSQSARRILMQDRSLGLLQSS